MVGLLRREHGGGLVEDQELGAAVERLEDLHALPLADRRDRATRASGSTSRWYSRPSAASSARALRHARAEPEAALDAEHDVLQHRERLHQHEVLVHHADAGGERVLRALDAHRAAAHEDLARVGLVVAVEDAHQRRLAGAVLADDAVDRPGPHGERHVAVGVDRAEALVDAAELDHRTDPGRRGRLSRHVVGDLDLAGDDVGARLLEPAAPSRA